MFNILNIIIMLYFIKKTKNCMFAVKYMHQF